MANDNWYDLDTVYESLHVGLIPDALHSRIAETIVRLPDDMASFALHNIHWQVFVPSWNDTVYPLWQRPPLLASTLEEYGVLVEQIQQAPAMERYWCVLLNHDLSAEDRDPDAARATIAHKIAHAVLGHEGHGDDVETARAADRLATDWGFDCWPSWVDSRDQTA
jgi:hypothetical protein